MTNEEILQQVNNIEWDGEGDPVYSYNQLVSAMDAARKDEVMEFEKWKIENGGEFKKGRKWYSIRDCLGLKDYYTPDELYTRFLNRGEKG